jgi:hypothetical protein
MCIRCHPHLEPANFECQGGFVCYLRQQAELHFQKDSDGKPPSSTICSRQLPICACRECGLNLHSCQACIEFDHRHKGHHQLLKLQGLSWQPLHHASEASSSQLPSHQRLYVSTIPHRPCDCSEPPNSHSIRLLTLSGGANQASIYVCSVAAHRSAWFVAQGVWPLDMWTFKVGATLQFMDLALQVGLHVKFANIMLHPICLISVCNHFEPSLWAIVQV